MLTLLLTLSAHAAECATPFSTTELREVIATAKGAIDEGDKAAHALAGAEIAKRSQCLNTQIPTSDWADYLVTEALIKFLEKQPGWEQALKVALQLAPNHPDVQDFILEDYVEPSDPPGEPTKIPSGVVVFIDGKVVTEAVPPLAGLHMAQMLEDGVWTTRMLRGEPYPAEWLKPRAVQPPQRRRTNFASWGTLGLSASFGSWNQGALEGDDRVIPAKASGVGFDLATRGQLYFVKPVGVFWWGDLGLQAGKNQSDEAGFAPFGDFYAGVSFFDAPLSLWVGGGGATVRVHENDKRRPFPMWNYLVGVSLRTTGTLPIDAAVGGGLMPWGHHLRGDIGATIVDLGPVGLRVGARGKWVRAKLGDATETQDDRDALAAAQRWNLGIFVGLAFGGKQKIEAPAPTP